MEEKILKQRGGKREGAGRKKSLPEDARLRTFALNDEEMQNVRRFITSMRKEKAIPSTDRKVSANQVQEQAINILKNVSTTIAGVLIGLNGGAPYENVELAIKDAAMIGFKDAVSEYERHRKAK